MVFGGSVRGWWLWCKGGVSGFVWGVGSLFGLCDCESPGLGQATLSWLSISRFVHEMNPTHAGISTGRGIDAPRDRRNEIRHNVDVLLATDII